MNSKRRHGFLLGLLAGGLLLMYGTAPARAQTADYCFGCHEDMTLKADDGKAIGVNPKDFKASVHGDLECIDCHTQKANYDDIPHFDVYKKVDCSQCHGDEAASYKSSFHGTALARGVTDAPTCASCHGVKGNPHEIEALNKRTAENACRQCHASMADRYDGSVHAVAAKQGKGSPGCVTCHPTHSAAMPPSVGAINNLCESCHSGAMKQVWAGVHKGAEAELKGAMSCASCHDVHATHKPALDQGTLKACNGCHPGYADQFKGSVHEDVFASGGMTCFSCHRTHQVRDASEQEHFGCGACHTEEEEQYRSSAHRLARLRGDQVAATCTDCHDGHHVLPPSDPKSMVNRRNIPETCGECHGKEAVVTSDFVRLPISLPNYTASVHGAGHKAGNEHAAVCTDCHGVHDLQGAAVPTSTINKRNLANTCGQCHEKEAKLYQGSVHGRAVAHGIEDSPSCTDCHDEHLILPPSNPKSTVNPEHLAETTCAKCHQNPEMAAKYGLPAEVIESYKDSYHGWAIKRGGKAVAVCIDCHTTHDIRSPMDPKSSTNPNNVVATCGHCHENSNAKFAASYTHILARNKLMVHDYVRIVYIFLITIVLGGMAVHNIILFIHEMKIHYRDKKKVPAVMRMNKSELIQHLILFLSFTGLAITGFALRFPDVWWVRLLTDLGLTEFSRRVIHRVLALILVGSSIYHVLYLVATHRGRLLLRAILPKLRDVGEAIGNVGYYLGLRKKPPVFAMYDYTQKAEYWALIWGTAVMAITGFVLWFPTIATSWLPAWVVRVCETIHFYEAILAVSAIIIWHFFFTIFLPREYPMSWTWVNGRMTKEEWDHHHGHAEDADGIKPDVIPGEKESE